jgi:hypothetical protein
LAVRYRSDLRSDDLTRWWMDRVSHLSMDHSSHWWTVMSHYQNRSVIRCLNRFANSCQIRWLNDWSTMERYSFRSRCNLADRYSICFQNHRCWMARCRIGS